MSPFPQGKYRSPWLQSHFSPQKEPFIAFYFECTERLCVRVCVFNINGVIQNASCLIYLLSSMY